MKIFNFKDLKKRVLISIILISLIIFLLYFHKNIFIIPILIAIVTLLTSFSILEFIKISKQKNIFLKKIILIPSSIFLILSFYLLSKNEKYNLLPFILLLFIFILLFLSRLKEISGTLEYLSISFFSLIYIAFPLGLIFPILYSEKGIIFLIYTLLITKSADIGAYFGGRIFGKNILCKEVSPKKTYEGVFSSFIFAISIGIVFTFFTKEITISLTIILSSILTLFAIIGDLIESIIKRDVQIKDSSNLPGFGGFLDMLDSLLLNLPIIYFYIKVFR